MARNFDSMLAGAGHCDSCRRPAHNRHVAQKRASWFWISMTILRSKLALPLVLTSLVLSLDGCRVIGGIFKAGVWVGVIAVFLVVALVLWLARAISSR